MNLSLAITELEKLFSIFNEKYFESKLEKPIISIQTSGKKEAYGWFTVDKVWINKNDDKSLYEINISAEYLNRDIHELCSTLLHEMCHEYNALLGLKDTSNGLIYHNKKFRETASKMLDVKHDSRLGWSVTSLSEDTKTFVDTLNIDSNIFDMSRLKIAKKVADNKYKLYTYECECGNQIKSKVYSEEYLNNVLCEICESHFYFVESKRGRKGK